MEKTWLLYFTAVVSLAHCFLACLAMNNVHSFTTDQSALLAFKAHITFDHPHHKLANNWSTNISVCDWIGVTCGKRHHKVTALNLANMGLGGTIPPHIGNLSFLSYFNISNNNFHGHLLNELARLHRLKVVDLRFNNFSGNVPSLFGNLTKIQYLLLSNNSFTGLVPPSLGNISALESLNLMFNSLQGRIPKEIGYLPKLKWLRMANNGFSGSIPPTIFNISSLQYIDFSSATLAGSLPKDLCVFLPKLEFLYLSSNEFDGQIPSTLGECRKLQIISLSYNKFSGIIPRGIENLTMLKELYLGDNSIKGEIPPEMGNLHNLEILAIESANLIGVIPFAIFNISSLKELNLWTNNLFGTLPRDMCSHHTLLQVVLLDNNKLTGSIPRDIGNCTFLKGIALGDNKLTGLIPEEIGKLQNINMLELSFINLTGPIPATIFNSSTLKVISIVGNQLTGDLPSSIGLLLSNLEELYLGRNDLSGIVPNSISNASKLTRLDISGNSFSGSVPSSLGNLRNLELLNLEGNNFTSESSSPELSFLTSLTSCKQLKNLWISGNPLNGILPASIGNLSNSLESVKASYCGIRGSIPVEIGNLSNLAFLFLGSNELIGFIPTSIKSLRELQILSLDSNQMQGFIPVDLCYLTNLGELSLEANNFSGIIPACLGNITSLRYLVLSLNKLTSTIPTSLWNLNDLLELSLSSNYLSGYLPQELGNLKVALWIDLSMNQFSGKIPSTIGGLQSVNQLSLAYNKLQGPFPQSIGSLINLEFCDLSHNNLSGVIPMSLEALSQLRYFNVSFNRLTGEIPSRGPFANFTSQSFMSNKALCGASRFQVPLCHTGSQHQSRAKKMLLFIFIMFPILSILLAMTYVFAFISRCQKRNEIPIQNDLLFPISHERITYLELSLATNMFSEGNLLGIGSFSSVYKGMLPSMTTFAVKVFNLDLDGAFKSFETECEILRNVRHRNLTKVINSCSTLDFKAIILEYMPNGTLEKWLYSHNYFLDMLQKLDIMIDVACALEYLHHGYSVLVAHCDVKPSNVLLDDDMVAHVSDFGIAKLLGVGESIAQTKTLATFGYIAPEYGLEGLVSTKCDVYSYGIMLMETFTRIKPTDARFDGDLSMKCWVADALPNAIVQVLDANLLRPENEHNNAKLQCAASIMQLALNCSADSPMERMNMKDVLVAIKKIKLLYVENCK